MSQPGKDLGPRNCQISHLGSSLPRWEGFAAFSVAEILSDFQCPLCKGTGDSLFYFASHFTSGNDHSAQECSAAVSVSLRGLSGMTQRKRRPWSASSFEDRYKASPDPWNFAASPYERDRYRCVLNELERPAYDVAFEAGCSIGELTALLAHRCQYLIAVDIAPTAVAAARQRCKAFSNVEIRCESIVSSLSADRFDLIIFSEIAYYFSASFLSKMARSLHRNLELNGEFVAAHWLGRSDDHQLHGDEVHEILMKNLQLAWIKGRSFRDFRIDTWGRQ